MAGFLRFRVASVRKLVVTDVHYETSDLHDAIVEFRSAHRQNDESDLELLGTTDGRTWSMIPFPDPQHALGGFD